MPLLAEVTDAVLLARILGGSYLGMAALTIGLSIPLLFDKIGPNHFYGVRIKKSFSSEANWYAINRYGARWMIATGLAMALVAVWFWFQEFDPESWAVLPLSLAPLLLLVPPLFAIYAFARKLP
jgi:uncharacterized membrane protein